MVAFLYGDVVFHPLEGPADMRIAEYVNSSFPNGLRLDNSSFSCIMVLGGDFGGDVCPTPYREVVPGLWKALLPGSTENSRVDRLTSEEISGPLRRRCGPEVICNGPNNFAGASR